ncbi:hypothetical protein [Falsirhodobacter deserti]|uniref:hypothetical protein n=1 Tax=Falsirhodobacter deserti TaxID=1365611 RepID=UPI000FE365F5|nr:hypothetical protein [Falsirhodobacter deserti]
MKKTMLAAALIATAFPMIASAGPVERACLRSDRGAGNAQICSCIQQAADMTLNSSDQHRAAAFFKDPDEAQAMRVSRKSSDSAFWNRYKSFGQAAQAYCG